MNEIYACSSSTGPEKRKLDFEDFLSYLQEI